MQCSNIWGKRPKGRKSYAPSGSSRPGRTASGHAEATSTGSCARAASMAARSSSEGSGVISSFTGRQAKVDRTRGRWELMMGRRRLALLLVPAFVFAGAAAASPSPGSWAAPQIRAVTAAGLMGTTNVATFRADDPLTAQTLEDLAFGLKQRIAPPLPVVPPVVPPYPPVTDPTPPTTRPTPTPPAP